MEVLEAGNDLRLSEPATGFKSHGLYKGDLQFQEFGAMRALGSVVGTYDWFRILEFQKNDLLLAHCGRDTVLLSVRRGHSAVYARDGEKVLPAHTLFHKEHSKKRVARTSVWQAAPEMVM